MTETNSCGIYFVIRSHDLNLPEEEFKKYWEKKIKSFATNVPINCLVNDIKYRLKDKTKDIQYKIEISLSREEYKEIT